MKKKLKLTAVISAIIIIIIITWLVYLYNLANLILPVDISQDYRKIQGSENIVFVKNGVNDCYKRTFWGLQKYQSFGKDTPPDICSSDSSLYRLSDLIHTENQIYQSIYSPNKKYILYCEIEDNYKNSGINDDEHCYYRVYEIESGTIITIYRGYREWYHLLWL